MTKKLAAMSMQFSSSAGRWYVVETGPRFRKGVMVHCAVCVGMGAKSQSSSARLEADAYDFQRQYYWSNRGGPELTGQPRVEYLLDVGLPCMCDLPLASAGFQQADEIGEGKARWLREAVCLDELLFRSRGFG